MSSVAQDELSNLTNDQLRSRLLQHGLGNMPVTSTTREVLIKKLRKTIEGTKTDSRRETIHATSYPREEISKPGPASKKAANRRNTMSAAPMSAEDIIPITKPKNTRRSGRITPTTFENGNSAPISLPPSENNIMEVDEESVREVYVRPKRTSRSPSLGKSQTVVTSYKIEVAKPNTIVESNEEDDDESNSNEEENEQNNYPSLSTTGFNGYNNLPTAKSQTSTLRRTTTHKTTYEPAPYKPLSERNYNDVPMPTFKAPISKPSTSSYISSSGSGLNRRYTTNTYTSKQFSQDYEEDSATEQSDIDAPYLSDFAKRLSQLRPEPLDRKIIADVKQQHHYHGKDDSLWQSFSNLVFAFARKFGTIVISFIVVMILVFVYVVFFMG